MPWRVERIVNYSQDKLWGKGFAQFGFHDGRGRQCTISCEQNWVGCLNGDDGFEWTAGPEPVAGTRCHIEADIKSPVYLASVSGDAVLVSSGGNKRVYRIDERSGRADLIIDGSELGMTDMGNCEPGIDGTLWINEIRGNRIWHLDPDGRVIDVLGDGTPGCMVHRAGFDSARFNHVFDLRRGPDDRIYVLDSANFGVRMIDPETRTVTRIAGTGIGGFSGDGGSALAATLGTQSGARFDGPWSLSLDEKGNIYIGDTQNHVVRAVDRATGMISTIAGKSEVVAGQRNDPDETDPLKLNLPLICSMEYFGGRLFVPEWGGDLIVLRWN